MRASTVFALALALLLGLAAAAGAKYAGLFEKKAAPAAVVEKAVPTKVLVARMNLFEDVTVTADQVGVRELSPTEEAALQASMGGNGNPRWKEKLMPALTSAAHFRVAKGNIPADRILMKDDFTDQMLPEELSKRLEPNTRAVNVSLPKDKVAGGVIRVGEYVDVLLTTKVGIGNREELRTANIARGCKVVMKRNTPWALMVADPDDKPLHFTLQANPYRAALIEYGQTHGQLSLMPAPASAKIGNGTFSDPTSAEYATEDQRVEKMMQGVLAIGDEDLIRVFKIIQPKAPAPAAPAVPPVVIYHLSGVNDAGKTVIPAPVAAYQAPGTVAPAGGPISPSDAPITPAGGGAGATPAASGTPTDGQAPEYTFKLPSATGSGCKSCDEAKRKAAAVAKGQ